MKGERALSHVYDAQQLRLRLIVAQFPALLDLEWFRFVGPNVGWVANVPVGGSKSQAIFIGGPKP